jgi:EAL domain-containing protein (putative c-di-GMP-specific phosphodiesterase class I)
LELPGFEGMTVSINVSTRQLQRAVFCDRVTELLKKI